MFQISFIFIVIIFERLMTSNAFTWHTTTGKITGYMNSITIRWCKRGCKVFCNAYTAMNKVMIHIDHEYVWYMNWITEMATTGKSTDHEKVLNSRAILRLFFFIGWALSSFISKARENGNKWISISGINCNKSRRTVHRFQCWQHRQAALVGTLRRFLQMAITRPGKYSTS